MGSSPAQPGSRTERPGVSAAVLLAIFLGTAIAAFVATVGFAARG